MKILLIHPQNEIQRYESGHYGWFLRYAAVTMPTLAALVPPELGAEVRVVDEMVEVLDLEAEADLVGITSITSAAPRAYEIADRFRARGIPVVMGGVHATLNPDEAAAHADALVLGYAEETWPALLRDHAAGRMRARYEHEGEFSPEAIVAPDRSHIPRFAYIAPHTLEMSRGCSKRCEFCVSHQFHPAYVWKDIDRTLEEIRSIGSRLITFLDPNVVGSPVHARRFFSRMVGMGKRWMGCVTIDAVQDPELLDLLVESGCLGLLIGFESTSQASLDAANKGFSKVEDYVEVVRMLHRRGILLQGTFVLGFDTDTRESFDEMADFLLEAPIDLAQITAYTPFPGTAAYRRLEAEGRILTKDWGLYNGHNVVFWPENMSPLELQQGIRRVWERAYSHGGVLRRMLAPPWLPRPAVLLSNLNLKWFVDGMHRRADHSHLRPPAGIAGRDLDQ